MDDLSTLNSDELDFVATRILAEDRKQRKLVKHTDIREEGILSQSQQERRHTKEVYSRDSVTMVELTSLSFEQFWSGVFGRVYRRSERQRQPWWGGDPLQFLGETDG